MSNSKPGRQGVVYSTNPDFSFQTDEPSVFLTFVLSLVVITLLELYRRVAS